MKKSIKKIVLIVGFILVFAVTQFGGWYLNNSKEVSYANIIFLWIILIGGFIIYAYAVNAGNASGVAVGYLRFNWWYAGIASLAVALLLFIFSSVIDFMPWYLPLAFAGMGLGFIYFMIRTK